MKIISLLGEAYNQNKANLPLDKDILYKAKQKYPQYSGTQALTLYIADEMKEKDQIDSNQNRLIDTQKRENERLRGEVQSIGQELENFERQTVETDREVARLKQLSGMLTTGGASTQQNAKVSANALEKLQKELATLKTKPGMDPKVYSELTSQIETLKTNKSTDTKDVKKLQDTIRDIENDASVNYNQISMQLKDTEKRLKEKEHRFQEYKKKTTRNTKKIKEFENEFQIAANLRAGIQQDAQDISDMKDEIKAQLDLINDVTSKITRQQVAPMANNAQNDSTIAPKAGPGPNADILGSLVKGPETEKNITKGAENMLGRKLAEDIQQLIKPLQKYGNKEYDEWLTKHLPALIKVFKNKYWRDLEKTDRQYSDDQIHYIIEKYTPILYNLGDEDTPLTAQQVNNWLVVVKSKLWEQPVQNQLNLFKEGLDKTYARMLDNLIGLDYIKKG
jgi:hypothetical protein